MPILVTCKCNKKFRADDKHAGKQSTCPKCGQPLDIIGPTVSAFDVFVSYSSKDKTTCDALCATFERKGLRCWIAPRDILPGDNWGEAIIGGIEQCRVMVLVFSSHSNESPQVKREVERAVSKGMAVIPLRIEAVKLSRAMEYFISSQHWLDALTPPLEKHLDELASKVKRFLADDGMTEPASRPTWSNPIPFALPIPESTGSPNMEWPSDPVRTPLSSANAQIAHRRLRSTSSARRLTQQIAWGACGASGVFIIVLLLWALGAFGKFKPKFGEESMGNRDVAAQVSGPNNPVNENPKNSISSTIQPNGTALEQPDNSAPATAPATTPVVPPAATIGPSFAVMNVTPASELAAMQGVWSAIAEEFHGAPTSAKEIRNMNKSLSVIGNSFVIERSRDGKRQRIAGTIQLVPNAIPKQFDWSGTSYDGMPLKLLGLYELNGDSLRVVFDWQSNDSTVSRPTEFASVDGTSINVITFQRFAAAPRANWTNLFNGIDLAGWQPVASDGAWSVKDGVLSSTPGDGWLATEADYGDFELELEYRLPPEGNSGVFLRAPISGAPGGSGLLEVQAIDDEAPPFLGEPEQKRTGSVWGLFGGSPRAKAPRNQWNQLWIRAVGPHITVAVNGQKVTDGSLADQPSTALTPNMQLPSGRIGLQRRGATSAEFRNIRIRNLSDGVEKSADLLAIQGDWKLIAEEYSGVATNADEIALMKKTLKVEQDQFVIERAFENGGMRSRLDGAIQLDSTTSPKQFNWNGTDFLGQELTLFGLYELNGDTLRIVYNWKTKGGGDSRPTFFATKGVGGGNTMSTFQRIVDVDADRRSAK